MSLSHCQLFCHMGLGVQSVMLILLARYRYDVKIRNRYNWIEEHILVTNIHVSTYLKLDILERWTVEAAQKLHYLKIFILISPLANVGQFGGVKSDECDFDIPDKIKYLLQ